LLSFIDIFFYHTPRHPRSTLFPYTTLFRSVLEADRHERQLGGESVTGVTKHRRSERDRERDDAEPLHAARDRRHAETGHDGLARSEEHTSELQSLAYLVCRLLLEKKKNTKN